MAKYTFLALALILTSCAHSVHLVHVGDLDPYVPFAEGKTVKARAEQFVILGFIGNVDYVAYAYKKLMSQCQDGRIVGITTEYMTNLGFFSWHNRIYMTGHCLTKA